MSKKIIAVLEQRDGQIKKASFEAASVSYNLAKELNTSAVAVVVGGDIQNINEVGKYGISTIVHFKNESLNAYSTSAYADLISEYINTADAEYIILPHTSLGRDLAPFIAVKAGAGIVTDCTAINVKEGELQATRPVYAGKAVTEVKFKSSRKVITIRPNVFKASSEESSASPSVEVKEAASPNLKSRVVETKTSAGKLDVAEADVIVSGGRGLKSPENFKMIEDLASALGAAVGASRAVVDAGWRPHREQVGQTGKTVSPSLYVACGISGAIQHLAGMSSSKYIVAINKDKEAPIFSVADYGIAGDIFEILPVLTEEIKKIKS